MIFQNRRHAGKLLAEKIKDLVPKDIVILALPRGGVPVAAEIAAKLDAALDVLVVRKIGAPLNPEFALGAMGEDKKPILSREMLNLLGLEPSEIDDVVKEESKEIDRQLTLFRGNKPKLKIKGKPVLIVDDGLATGSTAMAAVEYVKKQGVSEIFVGVPVAARTSAEKLREVVDGVLTLAEPEDFQAVSQWYFDFSPVDDEEVRDLLQLKHSHPQIFHKSLTIDIDGINVKGDLNFPENSKALVLFAHGSGSSRLSPRNQAVANHLNQKGIGTLLFDLLTDEETRDRKNVFDIPLLARRLLLATRWVRSQKNIKDLPIGYFGASTGAGAALLAASQASHKDNIFCIVSRGGRPDLAGTDALKKIKQPVLLIVGGADYECLELNRDARKDLKVSHLEIIPNATHLFEEPGAMDEVANLASDFFLKPFQKEGQEVQIKTSEVDFKAKVKASLHPIIEQESFKNLIDRVKDCRVVMLGEASHGTEDFYQIRRFLSEDLIRNHGFKFIAVEGDWPDAHRLNTYITQGRGASAEEVLKHNHRWPTWMWANTEVANLAEWMRAYGGEFFGLDIYSLFESIDSVLKTAKHIDKDIAAKIASRYSCFDPFQRDEISYARSLSLFPEGCQREVIANLQELLDLRLNKIRESELFSTQQNARIVVNAETYYRAMLEGDATSWNVRDSHMMDTLDRLLDRFGEAAKVIVWAHNTHIGDYRATDMARQGYINIGGLARESYGEENVALVGFGTYSGQVLAGRAWGAPEEIMNLPKARSQTLEAQLHEVAKETGHNNYFLVFDEIKDKSSLMEIIGHRAVGVVYSPEHEGRGQYVPTILPKRYDAFVYLDQTKALSSLHSIYSFGEIPETWPMGQ